MAGIGTGQTELGDAAMESDAGNRRDGDGEGEDSRPERRRPRDRWETLMILTSGRNPGSSVGVFIMASEI